MDFSTPLFCIFRNFSYRFGKTQGVNRSSSKKGDTAASIGSVATLPKNAPAGALIHTMNEIAKYGDMINEIKEVLQSARQNAAQQVNTELLTTCWNIGRIIVEYEQQSKEHAEYGQQTLNNCPEC